MPSEPGEPIGPHEEFFPRMLASIEAAAEAVEQGFVTTRQQLDELRDVTRRLRRGIEVYTISASVPCPRCGDLYVPLASSAPCCSDSLEESEKADVGA